MIRWIAMLVGWMLLDLLWWRAADARLRALKDARIWRWVLGTFVCIQTLYILMVAAGSILDHVPDAREVQLWPVTAYIWHLFVLPLSSLAMAGGWLRRKLRSKLIVQTPQPHPQAHPAPMRPTRRQLLTAAGVALPPLISTGVGAIAVSRMGAFRVREVTIDLPSLPADLNGLTIAHVTDLHIGRFLPDGTMERVAEATNALQADLVVFTGDLLDVSCESTDLAIKFIKALDRRNGLAVVEGNHDLMRGSDWYEGQVLDAGVPLLLDQSATFKIPGRATPVQMLGLTWGEIISGKEAGQVGKAALRKYRNPTQEWMLDSVQRTAALRQPDAFPILLAHHPHAFDPATAAGLPLTLAGHTHGGQIMLTPNIGAGPLRFKYWAGQYTHGNSKLFVNNGVGNWFPLRVNAPAEIVKLTLRKA